MAPFPLVERGGFRDLSFLGSNGRSSGENEVACIWMRWAMRVRNASYRVSLLTTLGVGWLWAYPGRRLHRHQLMIVAFGVCSRSLV
jgi:hypothetical protein